MASMLLGEPEMNFTLLPDINLTNVVTIVTGAVASAGGAAAAPGSVTLKLTRLVCELWVAFPLALLGIVGNLVALVVLGLHKQKLTTTVLLQALAVTDTCVLLITLTLRSSRYLNMQLQHDVTWQYYFRWAYPCLYFVRFMDTWLTVLLTVDRYIAVCHPLRATRLCTRSRTFAHIGACLVLGLAFCAPRFFEFRMRYVIDPATNATMTSYTMAPLMNDKMYTFVYRIGLFFVSMYLVPMLLLILLNGKLLLALKEAHAQRSSMAIMTSSQTHRSSSRTNRSVTVIVVTVVLVSIACNTCAMVSHILWSLELCFRHLYHVNVYRRYVSNISNVLVTLNSAINFVIYCLVSRNFRSVLARVLCRCRRTRREPPWVAKPQHHLSSGTLSTSLLRFSSGGRARKHGSHPEINGLLRPAGGASSRASSRSPSPLPSATPTQGFPGNGQPLLGNGYADELKHFRMNTGKDVDLVADCRL